MNSAAKNNSIAIKKLISYISIEKYFKICASLCRFLRSFNHCNLKTNAGRKILITDLESTSKKTSIKRRKTLILGYVHKVKFYQNLEQAIYKNKERKWGKLFVLV